MTANDKIKAVAKAVVAIAQAIHDNNGSCPACPLFRTDACYAHGSATAELDKITEGAS